MGMSKEASEILHRDIMSDTNPVMAWSRAVNRALAPGEGLDKLNRRAVEVMCELMGRLRSDRGNVELEKGAVTREGDGAVVDFWAWTTHVIVQATTEAVYGPGNLFKEQAFEDSWKQVPVLVPLHCLFIDVLTLDTKAIGNLTT